MTTSRPAAKKQPAPKIKISSDSLRRGISRIEQRISELRAFDFNKIPSGSCPELVAMSASIKDTLERCFGEDTSAYRRFDSATSLQLQVFFMTDNYSQRQHYVNAAQQKVQQSILLLEEAKRTINEDLVDIEHNVEPDRAGSQPISTSLSRRVFLVHGHDEGAREMVARFLEKIGFEPVILHEQASKKRTVIEKIEAHHDVTLP